MLEAAASSNVGAAPRNIISTAFATVAVAEDPSAEVISRIQKRKSEKAEGSSKAYTPLAFPIEDIFESIKEEKLLR